MNFSSGAFQTNSRSTSTLSSDTMSHAQMVQACRFGWSAGPNNTTLTPFAPTPGPVRERPNTLSSDARSKRLTPCRGRLYHQLTCSHRIRTDLVEDCGPNCLEPFGAASAISFYCQECVEKEAAKIWESREAHHNALYPSMDCMTKEQYEGWYDELRRLEARFSRDRKVYEAELRANTRPSNVCSVLEMSSEEKDFAAELDALSLSLMFPNDSSVRDAQSQHRHRVSLPNDASEQLHWGLNSLTLDRGSCGVEYSPGRSVQTLQVMTKEQTWKRPRDN